MCRGGRIQVCGEALLKSLEEQSRKHLTCIVLRRKEELYLLEEYIMSMETLSKFLLEIGTHPLALNNLLLNLLMSGKKDQIGSDWYMLC